MLDHLSEPVLDPILSLSVAFRQDPRPEKVDLGIGVYKNSQGQTPIMQAVQLAQQKVIQTQTTKSYVGLAGCEEFNHSITQLVLVMIYIVGGPVSGIMSALTEFLNSMGSTNAVLLGIILGAMMCFDLGGPVNKAAYTFGVGLLASNTYAPMAAIMAAGMVPALGMGLATFLAKNKFAASEREAGKASFVLGLCFISEGAIPFAAKDPMRVIPACMVGGALTGALSMLFGAQLMAPHGGLFVLLIPNAITPVLMYLVAIAAGTIVTGVGYAFLKSRAAASTQAVQA